MLVSSVTDTVHTSLQELLFLRPATFSAVVGSASDTACLLSRAEQTRAESYKNEKRKTEFSNGRLALKAAFLRSNAISLSDANLLSVASATSGAPLLPKPYHGSIAHKDGIAVAVVTDFITTAGIGIDLEYYAERRPATRLERMIELIGDHREHAIVESLNHDENCSTFLILFSLKEAGFKTFRGRCRTLKELTFLHAENTSNFKTIDSTNESIALLKATMRYGTENVTAVVALNKPLLVSLAWR